MKSISLIAVLMLTACVNNPTVSTRELGYAKQTAKLTSRASVTDPTEAMAELYKIGEPAIPEIATLLTNREQYYGWGCGGSTYDSGYVLMNPGDDSAPKARSLEVREVALYLIVAIKKRDLYHQYLCYMNIMPRMPDSRMMRLEAQMRRKRFHFDHLELDRMLQKYDLRFVAPASHEASQGLPR